MRIDLYHLERHTTIHNFVSYPILDTLKLWTEESGRRMEIRYGRESQIDLETDAEVIAFHVYTYTAPAAYRLADKLRAKGKVVILGGPHFQSPRTVQEGMQHAEVVVQSVCREGWETLLRKIDSGAVKPNTHSSLHITDPENAFRFPDNLHEAYGRMPRLRIPLVMASLGCPYSCEFCNPFSPGKLRTRDIDTVYREIDRTDAHYVGFCDATFGLNRPATIELMRKIAPLKRRVFVETTLSRLDNDDLLNAMAEGGVGWVAVGVESLSAPQKKHGRSSPQERSRNIQRIIDKVTARGMLVQVNFICGLDDDDTSCFDRIYDFYTASTATAVYVDLMVPYPNSRLFERLEADGRILDYDWSRYDYRHLVYKPLRMTPEQLIDGFNALYKSLTGPRVLLSKTKETFDIIGSAGMPMILWNATNVYDAVKKRDSLNRCKRRIS